MGLAGPGLPEAGADIVLVPADRRTGEPWRPPGGAVPVALPPGMWTALARPETSPMPASGTLPEGVLRDDYPLPRHPCALFRPEYRAFRHTLARTPEVRRPWLREIYERSFRAGPLRAGAY